jgi:hypothetical protein
MYHRCQVVTYALSKVTDILFSRLGRNFAERFGMVAKDSPRLGAWLVKLRPCVRAWFTSSDARVLRWVDVCGNLTTALDCDGSADFDVTLVFYSDHVSQLLSNSRVREVALCMHSCNQAVFSALSAMCA